MNQKSLILLTGGGTAGHVTPNIALIPYLKEKGYELAYVGSHNGIEKELITKENIPYYSISTGKLRRYISLENITDIFRVGKGFIEAYRLLKKLSPKLIFSKGGFVSVPLVKAAGLLKIPVILHESDMSIGLANKLCIKDCTYICCNFPEAMAHLPEEKAVLTGTPIRDSIGNGDSTKGYTLTGFTKDKPVLMIMGGSQGSQNVNQVIRTHINQLTARYQVIHLCGKNNLDPTLDYLPDYVQYEYVNEELPHLFAITDFMVSRAGANAMFEILSLKIPTLFIPLSRQASRGDQILNAHSFEKQGFGYCLEEEDLTKETFFKGLDTLYEDQDLYRERMSFSNQSQSIPMILNLIEEAI